MSRDERPDSESDPELADVARLLDEAAAQEEREMAEAQGLQDAPGLGRVEETLAAAWGESSRASQRRNWFRLLIAVGAAALVVAFFLLRGGGPTPSGPSGQYLGKNGFELVYPVGKVSRWDRVEWSGPKDATCRILILDPLSRVEIARDPGTIEANRRTLKPEDTARWPSHIKIELEMRQKDGKWVMVDSEDSELGP